MFFRSLPKEFLFRFLTLLGCFGGALCRDFCTNIDCRLENATSQKAWFYRGISTVLTVAAGPGSLPGEKNTHAEAMPVLASRKNRSANDFGRFLGTTGSHNLHNFGRKCVFFLDLFCHDFYTDFGEGPAAGGEAPQIRRPPEGGSRA